MFRQLSVAVKITYKRVVGGTNYGGNSSTKDYSFQQYIVTSKHLQLACKCGYLLFSSALLTGTLKSRLFVPRYTDPARLETSSEVSVYLVCTVPTMFGYWSNIFDS